MNIVICGGTGLIGSKLVETLVKEKHHIYILTRNTTNKEKTDYITYLSWLNPGDQPEKLLENIDVFINLAGETINSRWTTNQKERILKSRLEATRNCISLMEKLEKKPSVYLNASAVGFYGTSLTSIFTEQETHAGKDFLALVVEEWEAEAKKAEHLGIRTVFLRFGVVLADSGGALAKMILPYKLFAGGTVGSGQQWLSWVHIDDAVDLIRFAITNSDIQGPLNITSPNPMQMKEFGKTLGNVLGKPHWIPAPSFALKLILGEMSILVLEGQYVIPKKAIDHGFQFTYSNLNEALKSLNL
ncbi:TIGR01777 family oxidoreductase [Anaerobacillus isosaccharinicus]|uniref:TIGR01777 family protein n=1 Tax=Anaerobacillus isosaccharinicus TaxID=1532552 RepID=A0A1S2M942_9BACI|nr:TIGR01777 family oxidoreductase [Anaerobacillus isosaccharinicus]MBA5584919.1 TIGR01777 family protein [Anaerobacillus isosaccharinicus]QOY36723.1 TIGR01777 family protein [Anaerobacillus isosaccharinicus]